MSYVNNEAKTSCVFTCCAMGQRQTPSSKNLRITAFVLGILFTAAGAGLIVGVGSFGWALVSVGVLSVVLSCCLKGIKRYYQIVVPQQDAFFQQEEKNASQHSNSIENSPIVTPIVTRAKPVKVDQEKVQDFESWVTSIETLYNEMNKLFSQNILDFQSMGLEKYINTIGDFKIRLENLKSQSKDFIVNKKEIEEIINKCEKMKSNLDLKIDFYKKRLNLNNDSNN